MRRMTVRSSKKKRELLPIALNTIDAGRYLGISEAMMRKMRSLDDGPPYKTIGRKVVYLRKDLQQWLENK